MTTESPTQFLPEQIYSVTKQKCILFQGQMKCVQDVLDKLLNQGHQANLLQGITGSGKTFVLGTIIKYLMECGYIKELADVNNCLSFTKVMYITKASIVDQTKNDLRKFFGIDTTKPFGHPGCFVHVTNIDQIRSEFGEQILMSQIKFVGGEPTEVITCRQFFMPVLMIFDECHILKNRDSKQARCHHAMNLFASHKPETQTLPKLVQIHASATPFQRVEDARYFTLAAAPEWNGRRVTAETWGDFSRDVSYPSEPTDYVEAAMERCMEYLNPYVSIIKGERWQFKGKNSVSLINFESAADAAAYAQAWENYQKECALLDKNTPEGRFAQLAMFQKFRQAAELIRAPFIARTAIEQVMTKGKAFIGAVEFKATIARVVLTLIQEYGVPRDKISLIWGGMVRKKLAPEVAEKLMVRLEHFKQILEKGGMAPERVAEFADQFKLKHNLVDEDDVVSDLFTKFNMVKQTKQDRREEQLKFQRGDSLYCFFTFKAGGAGLSLHHTDEFTKEKCRRKKESNYAFVEDIPTVPTRPRYTVLTPVYSGIEMIQGLGRGPRLTSLSDTEQTVIYYRGTIEEEVAAVYKTKLKCIAKTTSLKEDWHELIAKGASQVDDNVSDDEDGETLDSDNMEIIE